MYYGPESLKFEGMLAVEITENDRQHTPTPRLCSSRAKRVDKDPEDHAKPGVHKIRYAQELFQSFPFIPRNPGG